MLLGMDTFGRIAQWENMTQADPENDMGWFSLGSAYKEAGRLADAEKALDRCLKLNPSQSRAYQLRAQALMQLGRNAEAGELLTRGYKVAAERGDVMPQRAMGSLLEKMGLPVPAVKPTQVPPEVASGQAIIDRRTGRPGPRLPDPPMRGPLGRFIFEHYTATTWREWIHMGTKVINELRLDFSNPDHQKVYEQHMMEWLGISAEDLEQFASQPRA